MVLCSEDRGVIGDCLHEDAGVGAPGPAECATTEPRGRHSRRLADAVGQRRRRPQPVQTAYPKLVVPATSPPRPHVVPPAAPPAPPIAKIRRSPMSASLALVVANVYT